MFSSKINTQLIFYNKPCDHTCHTHTSLETHTSSLQCLVYIKRCLSTPWSRDTDYTSHKLSLSSPVYHVLFLDVTCLALECVERQEMCLKEKSVLRNSVLWCTAGFLFFVGSFGQRRTDPPPGFSQGFFSSISVTDGVCSLFLATAVFWLAYFWIHKALIYFFHSSSRGKTKFVIRNTWAAIYCYWRLDVLRTFLLVTKLTQQKWENSRSESIRSQWCGNVCSGSEIQSRHGYLCSTSYSRLIHSSSFTELNMINSVRVSFS